MTRAAPTTDQRIPGLDRALDPVVRCRPTLDGRAWGLEWKWNTRAQLWYLAMSEASGELVLDGRAAVVSTDLLFGLPADKRPSGQLWIRDTYGRRAEVGRYDLGRRHRVLYRPIEVVELAAGTEAEVF